VEAATHVLSSDKKKIVEPSQSSTRRPIGREVVDRQGVESHLSVGEQHFVGAARKIT
jgi:hypothetical protein